jgi:hypothetical protein
MVPVVDIQTIDWMPRVYGVHLGVIILLDTLLERVDDVVGHVVGGVRVRRIRNQSNHEKSNVMVVFVIISVLIAILSIIIAIRCVWIDWYIKRYTDEYIALRDTKMTHKDTLKHHNRIKKELKELKKQRK